MNLQFRFVQNQSEQNLQIDNARKASASRPYGDPIRGAPDIPHTSHQYSLMSFRGALKWAPLMTTAEASQAVEKKKTECSGLFVLFNQKEK